MKRPVPLLSDLPIAFAIRSNPPTTTHQSTARILRKRDGTRFIGRPQNSKGASLKRTLISIFRKYAPPDPFNDPVQVEVVFEWQWNKADPQYVRNFGIIAAAGRADSDNLAKLFKDAFAEAGFVTNDNRISDLIVRKRRGDRPGLYVRVTEPELFPYHHEWI